MEKEQRSRLQKATQEARRLLEEEFSRQLLETYDINVATGRWSEEPGAHLQAEQRLLREKLLAWIEHRSAQINDEKEALLLALREMAFTALNRFVALKLMEARELVRPCVSGGLESEGFQEFTAVAQGLLVEQESSYRLYLETIFEDVSRELRALFDPRDPASLLWPKRTALLELLDILNRAELVELWREDETLGWIYQYFNGDAERKKMREESSAPRNSRELAVRNQFFTPRYVVEFLTDNTLGRIWYEMRQGDTGLKERCRYLVRRPNEIWLQPGEEAPAEIVADEALSQEELLRQPVHIPYRPLKDPREIRMLDPACGSMHFGLYAFDLYLEIYEEAWEIAQGSDEQAKQGEAFAPFVAYAADFPSKAAFLSEVPRLILQHNIHGVDIDPRATQIARLTLWLRAQRAWQEQGVEVAARPAISRSNVVCAEPMPGEKELLADFVDQQFPEAERGLVQQLLETIFDKMQLAGEAGSLLKIEEEIRDVIEKARREWQKLAIQQRDLFSTAELAALGRVGSAVNTDLQNLAKDFWVDIEERIYTALSNYSEQAEASSGLQRRLFADDAAQGFAFIDTYCKRYDAVLMNPPFGDAAIPSKSYIEATYGDTKGDLYKAFVECFSDRLMPAGLLGAITSRTGFFLGQSEDWRDRVVLRLYNPILLLDLGIGVLDALVETAAYVFRSLSESERLALTQRLASSILSIKCDQKGHFTLAAYAKAFGLKRHQAEQELRWLIETGNVNIATPTHSTVTEDGFPKKFINTATRPVYPDQPHAGSPHFECFQVLDGKDNTEMKSLLEEAISCHGSSRRFLVDLESFRKVPGMPFAYWVDDNVRDIFKKFPLFENEDRQIKQGACTNDDFRFTRKWLEIPNELIGRSRESTKPASQWVNFSKGGGNSPFYSSFSLVLNWKSDGKEIKSFISEYRGKRGWGYHWTANLNGHDSYFSAGLCWAVRTKRFSPHVVPKGGIFSAARYQALAPLEDLYWLLALMNSEIATLLLRMCSEWYERPKFIEGVVSRLPIPNIPNESRSRLKELAVLSYEILASQDAINEDSWVFQLPAIVQCIDTSLSLSISRWSAMIAEQADNLNSYQASIDDIARFFYGLESKPEDLSVFSLPGASEEIDPDEGENEACSSHANPHLLTSDLISYLIGVVFGRWDIRYSTGKKGFGSLPNLFSPLPICSPGMLQGPEGLPATPVGFPSDYPLGIAWSGILVSDECASGGLIISLEAALATIWPESHGAIMHEACALLGVASLRRYIRQSCCFFADHLKRYSKSRRQAPIYWMLAAGDGGYSVWLYYHRFTQDTLYRVLRDFVEHRIQQAERDQFELESQGGLSGDASSLLQEAQTLLQDLRIFKSELELVAPLWNPNLNDGVIINHAILWRITPYTPWQKKCKECWDKLVKGDYDWAHLAFHLWPERVIRKCTTDRSLAIAHGLEERLWQETSKGNWLQRQVSEAELQALLAEYRKPAVQNALERFLTASPPVADDRSRAPRSSKSSSTGTTRRPRGSAPEVDAETSRQTLLVLTAAPADGLGRNAIAELLAVEAASLTAVIKQLKEGGQIEQLGAARGAKYRLSESGLAAVESQAGEDD
jgi:hypothetical protein